jgi:AmmeMemoRadiSam system protein B
MVFRHAPIGTLVGPVRHPCVAGSFYPRPPARLDALVASLLDSAALSAAARPATTPVAILVPHAGLEYSGVVAAAGWRTIAALEPPATVVMLGTNHTAAWLDGIGIWEAGAWRTPTSEAHVDDELAAEIAALGGPFVVDREAHLDEHSIEVQLPLLVAIAPAARIVPLAVSSGRGDSAIAAGAHLGRLLRAQRERGERIVLAISTDMAHYPTADACRRVTEELLPAILRVDPSALDERERGVRMEGIPALACGMCGIEPALVGLAALREMGLTAGRLLASATSADAGGPPQRTVGYLAVAFEG